MNILLTSAIAAWVICTHKLDLYIRLFNEVASFTELSEERDGKMIMNGEQVRTW
jgi:hypothetical protein